MRERSFRFAQLQVVVCTAARRDRRRQEILKAPGWRSIARPASARHDQDCPEI
jgi:hypothetical protein